MNSPDAHKALQQGRIDEAERMAQQVLARAPRDVEALNVLGLVALRRGDTGLAQRWLERAAEADPKHSSTQHFLGRVHDAAGGVNLFKAELRVSVQVAPEGS